MYYILLCIIILTIHYYIHVDIYTTIPIIYSIINLHVTYTYNVRRTMYVVHTCNTYRCSVYTMYFKLFKYIYIYYKMFTYELLNIGQRDNIQ